MSPPKNSDVGHEHHHVKEGEPCDLCNVENNADEQVEKPDFDLQDNNVSPQRKSPGPEKSRSRSLEKPHKSTTPPNNPDE
ncbi:MAG: hypothetical protein OEZ43_07775 [Gammaproteobacteria bacterium]|nr:hypothetical protein [Gammaproteobacteria bacterium]